VTGAASCTTLEELLPTLAQALDIRQVFKQVSEITQGVIPHDMLVLSLLQPGGTSVATHALVPGGELEDIPTPGASLLALYRGGSIVRDISVVDPSSRTVKLFPLPSNGESLAPIELSLDPVRFRYAGGTAMRSLVAVPVQALGGFVGGLLFLSRRPDAYGPDDAALARRVADHVSLALAHQRLAEEEGRAAEARVLAARLAGKVSSLSQEIK
jgi:GAF domain-containing protein